MFAILAFMTSMSLIAFGATVVIATIGGSAGKIVAALAGETVSKPLPLPAMRHRTTPRITLPTFRAPPTLRAAA